MQIYKNSKKVDWLNFPSKPQYVHFEKEMLKLEGAAYQNKEQLKSWFYTKQQATVVTDSTLVSVYNFSELTPWSTLDTLLLFQCLMSTAHGHFLLAPHYRICSQL